MGIRYGAVLALVAACGIAAAQEQIPQNPPGETKSPSDQTIEASVSRALADDTRVHAMQMKVAVSHAVVTLTGTAADADEKEAAETVVRRVQGVREVENRLVIVARGEPEPGTSMIPEVPATPPAR